MKLYEKIIIIHRSIQKHELVIGNFILPEVSMSIFASGEESLPKVYL